MVRRCTHASGGHFVLAHRRRPRRGACPYLARRGRRRGTRGVVRSEPCSRPRPFSGGRSGGVLPGAGCLGTGVSRTPASGSFVAPGGTAGAHPRGVAALRAGPGLALPPGVGAEYEDHDDYRAPGRDDAGGVPGERRGRDHRRSPRRIRASRALRPTHAGRAGSCRAPTCQTTRRRGPCPSSGRSRKSGERVGRTGVAHRPPRRRQPRCGGRHPRRSESAAS